MLSTKGFFVCTIYMFVGPALVLLNQYILKSLDFCYPIFLSGMGVLASGIFAQSLVTFGVAKAEKPEAVQGLLWYKRVLPIGLAQAATLSFGNSVYLFLDVGFIQMLKAFTPVCIMITAYLAGIETPGVHLVIAVCIISSGTAITCGSAPDFHIVGMTFMFLSTFSEAIKLVFTQFLLQNVKMGVIETQLVTSPAAALWLFIASAICEFPSMYEAQAWHIIFNFFPYFLGACGMGIGVNFISALVIQYTSSLTMKILNIGRNVMTIIIGIMFYAEIVTRKAVIGYCIMLIGFALFNAVKMGYIVEKPTSKPTQATTVALHSSAADQNRHHSNNSEADISRLIDETVPLVAASTGKLSSV